MTPFQLSCSKLASSSASHHNVPVISLIKLLSRYQAKLCIGISQGTECQMGNSLASPDKVLAVFSKLVVIYLSIHDMVKMFILEYA